MHILYKPNRKVILSIKNNRQMYQGKIQRNKGSEGSLGGILAVGKVENVLKRGGSFGIIITIIKLRKSLSLQPRMQWL